MRESGRCCFQNRFDVIWACASLLHIAEDEIDIVLNKVISTVTTTGIVYLSWKYVGGTRTENGRYYVDMPERKLAERLQNVEECKSAEVWINKGM